MTTRIAEKEVVCPKCGTKMLYRIEVETNGNGKRITHYYKCPRCGHKIIDMIIRVNGNKNSAKVLEIKVPKKLRAIKTL